MHIKRSLISLAKPLVERFPRVATAYRGLRDQLDLAEEPIPTPWGFRLAGNSTMARGGFEPEETELVRAILKDVDVLVNIGANVGYYSCHALSMGKAVMAFEPIPRNVRYLCKNVRTNGWSCEIYPMALSNGVGVLEIFGGGTGASLVRGWAGASEGYVTLVPYSTLDLVLGTRLQGKRVLVLVDVEGAEKWVLDGSSTVLANDPKPTWLIEISVTQHQPRGVGINPQLTDTFMTMFSAGYQAYTADGKMHLVTLRDVEAAQQGDVSVLDTNSFLFR